MKETGAPPPDMGKLNNDDLKFILSELTPENKKMALTYLSSNSPTRDNVNAAIQDRLQPASLKSHHYSTHQLTALAIGISLGIAAAVLLILFVTTSETYKLRLASKRTVPADMAEADRKSKALTQKLAIGCVGGAAVLCLLIYIVGFKERRHLAKPLLGLISLGLLCAAFLPQLFSNDIYRAAATNHIMGVFLLMVVVGVLLKLTTFRLPYEVALKSGKVDQIVIVGFLMFTACVPLVAHNVWQWQCWKYDQEIAEHQRNLNAYAAPICSVLIAFVVVHVFLPEKVSLFTPRITRFLHHGLSHG